MSNNGFAVERDPLFNENNLIWMDLEMTGLEPQINRILEMAAVITDPQLNVIAEGPVVAIHQDAAILSAWTPGIPLHILAAVLLIAAWKAKSRKTKLLKSLLISSRSTCRPARARFAETPSVRTAVSWPAGHRVWSSSSITATSTFPPSKNVSNAGRRK